MTASKQNRYDVIPYRRCGNSGLKLPVLSFGLWQNFGDNVSFDHIREMCLTSFDNGICHFDLANNYGPPPGSAETNFGRILRQDLARHRDELIISSKAGYLMWPGPYGEWGSRKSIIASCDQSLARLGVDYVDIFYSHRFDPETPLEETMGALDSLVRQGKALYVGLSSYSASKTAEAAAILKRLGTPAIIHQPSYSMLNRWIETNGLLDALSDNNMGCIAFSPLAQGLLTDKYLNGIKDNSRAAQNASLNQSQLAPETLEKIGHLNRIAAERGQTLAQMAISWVLRDPRVTSALFGASRSSQILDCIQAANNTDFSQEELTEIDVYATESGINLWSASSAHN
ncbi:MAG: L-glyceraldehyde 3-phosphate reductase [Paracoccaceae bacterium]